MFARKILVSIAKGMVKKVIQQGHSHFDARSVLPVREHGKRARTLVVAFFNIPIMETIDLKGKGKEAG